jgi:hypothetical protein
MFMHCGRKKHEGKRRHVAKHLKFGGVGGLYLKFELQLKSNKIFIGFPDSRISGFPDSRIPLFPDSPIPGFPVPCFKDSRIISPVVFTKIVMDRARFIQLLPNFATM